MHEYMFVLPERWLLPLFHCDYSHMTEADHSDYNHFMFSYDLPRPSRTGERVGYTIEHGAMNPDLELEVGPCDCIKVYFPTNS